MAKPKQMKKYMFRCLKLASQAEGLTYPNPLVGAVIVYNDIIIGEGYHRKAGEKHAEVIAIETLKNKELLKESTIYVNLEPCSHFGKTNPCVLRIIEEKIPNVVVGTIDTNSKVSGKGIEKLRSHGVNVEVGILEKECRELNRRFFTFHEKKRPYIILKWAETEDGFIDIERDTDAIAHPNWITDESGRRIVHLWRSREQAILVGSTTAIKDNPKLTVRDWCGQNPLRLVLDRQGTLPSTLSLFDGETQTIVFTYHPKQNLKKIEFVKLRHDIHPIETILSHLYENKIQSLIVEGGATLINLFLEKNIWDEARIFIGNKWFEKGVEAPKINQKPIFSEKNDNFTLNFFQNY